MSCPDFELLSAYADQEVSAAERQAVESHLPGCADCRNQLANLGQVSRLIAPPLPAGFRVEARPRPRSGWWQRLRLLADSPVVHLVSTQRRRRARFGAGEMLKMGLLFGLPIALMCISPDRSSLTAFLLFSALGLMLGLPLRQFAEEVALLASLQRGRCLEEIVGTGTSAQGLLDGLALQGLMQIVRATVTVWPVLLLGTLGLPASWQAQALEMALLWPPALAALFLAGYYFAQFLQVYPGAGLKRLLLALLLLTPCSLALLGIAGAFAAALTTGLLARALAISGLNNPVRPRAIPVHKRNPLVRSFSQNAIARREMSRLAGQVGGDWRRLMAWRASMAILPVAWALHAVSARYEAWPDVFAGGMLLFSALFFVRSGLRTLPAVVREREQQSWEILLQTRLGLSGFVSGWLQVCLYTVFSEGLLAVLALTGYVLTLIPSDSWWTTLPALLLLPAASLLGAYLGLAISAASRNARQASQSLMFWSLASACGWLVTLGLLRGSLDRSADWGTYQPSLGMLSLASMLPVGLLLAARARHHMRLLPCIDPDEETFVQPGTRYNPSLACLDLASVVTLFYCLKTWNQVSSALELSDVTGASLLIGGSLAWWFLLRMPVASLSEAALGGRINLLIGPGFGLALSQSLDLAWNASPQSFLEMDSATTLLSLKAASLVLGALLGGMAAHRPTISDERAPVLIKRLRWAGLSLLLGLLAVLWWLSLSLPQAPVPSPGPKGEPDYSAQLARLAELMPDPSLARLDQLRALELPELGAPQAHVQLTPQPEYVTVLTVLSQRQEDLKQYQQAFNSLRWVLACRDESDTLDPFREAFFEENPSTLKGILRLLPQVKLKESSARELIAQLLDASPMQRQLKSTYQELTEFELPAPPLTPEFYLKRERAALQLARARAEHMIDRLELWKLLHSGGQELLSDVRYCSLARRQLDSNQLRMRLSDRIREGTLREGLALVVAIQLYRQQHGDSWPQSLDQVQLYLPRPVHCYTSQDDRFIYRPGFLSGRCDLSGNINLIVGSQQK